MNRRDSQVLISPQGITNGWWLPGERASVAFKSVVPGRLVALQCAERHHEDISMCGFNVLFKKEREYNIRGDREEAVDLGGVGEKREQMFSKCIAQNS